ncbi:hypothetical protein QWY86_15430 [Pedobacter aquatilis]|uniref:hypothetical protein n=1 Tax=Pedobacter aquatilis TaxID=351343 RepID=UPI0025B47A6C|nr:hypothetical protein [Pedobacter aquatilis]MDN3588074.1 hypothetical protein [Pedobacter aquatilis]
MAHSWEIKFEHKKALSLEDSTFIFEQSEKFLNDISESHKSVVERTYTSLAICVTILTALIAFITERVESGKDWDDSLTLCAILTTIYVFFGVVSLSRNIRSTNYMGLGSPPINLFSDRIMARNVPSDKRIIRVIVSEIERYQFRVEVNREINQKKWKVFNLGIYWLLSIPVFFFTLYLIIIAAK